MDASLWSKPVSTKCPISAKKIQNPPWTERWPFFSLLLFHSLDTCARLMWEFGRPTIARHKRKRIQIPNTCDDAAANVQWESESWPTFSHHHVWGSSSYSDFSSQNVLEFQPKHLIFTSQSLRNLNPGPAKRLIYMFWTGILLVTTKGTVLHLYIKPFIKVVYVFFCDFFSGWKGRHWSRWRQRRCWWNWSKRKWRTLRASRTNRCKGECPRW